MKTQKIGRRTVIVVRGMEFDVSLRELARVERAMLQVEKALPHRSHGAAAALWVMDAYATALRAGFRIPSTMAVIRARNAMRNAAAQLDTDAKHERVNDLIDVFVLFDQDTLYVPRVMQSRSRPRVTGHRAR